MKKKKNASLNSLKEIGSTESFLTKALEPGRKISIGSGPKPAHYEVIDGVHTRELKERNGNRTKQMVVLLKPISHELAKEKEPTTSLDALSLLYKKGSLKLL